MTPTDLRAYRRDTGHSQASLARALGVNVMTVSRWERGVSPISPAMAISIRLWRELNDRKGK